MWTRLLSIEVTGAEDSLSHWVAQPVYDQCVACGEGRYLALCGKVVLAAAMITQPGPVCRLCLASVSAGLEPEPLAPDRRNRRPS